MTSQRAADIFAASQQAIHRRTDRLFAGLMALQWIGGIAFALWVSPLCRDHGQLFCGKRGQ
jgi:hypothetical protein